jgi:hypothetical protein
MTVAGRMGSGHAGLVRWALGVFTAVLGLALAAGCHRSAATKSGSVGRSKARPEETLDAAWDPRRKVEGADSCSTAVQQLNNFFTRHADQRPILPAASLPTGFSLSEEELAEVNSTNFTLLDAHYLDLCFLLRDAARSFDVPELPPLKRAETAFGWVVRQVRLQDNKGRPLPPEFVVRRGWGSSRERAFLFLAVLQQMGIDGCLVTHPDGKLWVPGVLAGAEVYLFDTRLGLPLPGPKGEGIATLAQARTQADLFQILAVDDKHHYDVTPEQARQVEVHPAWPLSALAPRMKYLEDLLAAQKNHIRLAADPVGVLEKFRQSAQAQAIPVRVEDQSGDARVLVGLQRDFYPPGEGGNDKTRRKEFAEVTLIPWNALPRPVLSPSFQEVSLVQEARLVFAQSFTQFPLPAPPRNAEDARAHDPRVMTTPGAEKGDEVKAAEDDWHTRFVQLWQKAIDPHLRNQPVVHFFRAPKSVRDEVLRGHWHEATPKLVEGLDQVRHQKGLLEGVGDPNQAMERWCREAFDAQGAYWKAEREARSQTAEAQAALEAAGQRLQALRLGSLKNLTLNLPGGGDAGGRKLPASALPLPLWLRVTLGSAAKPLGAEATYLLALCKHEDAEQKQAGLDRLAGDKPVQRVANTQDAWKSAADWWKTCLEEYPTAPGAAAARLWRARALEALGQRDGARALLTDLSGGLTSLEETARLYLARRLK